MSFKGRKHTPEARQKISDANRGKNHPMYGKKLSLEHRQKISKALRGKKPSSETKQKISEANRGEKSSMWGKRGEKHPTWKGGRNYSTHGYILVYSPDHPNKNCNGYMLEHRLVVGAVGSVAGNVVTVYFNYPGVALHGMHKLTFEYALVSAAEDEMDFRGVVVKDI